MLDLQWIATTLYPAGYFTRRIPIIASATYPENFKSASALNIASTSGNSVTYKPVSYEVLADSPVYAGRYFLREEICPRVFLDVVGDSARQIIIQPDVLQAHRKLCQQEVKLFGSQHYDHYDFLLSISDRMGISGLEHHRSSEDGVGLGYFASWEDHLPDHDLLPHEYAHSWNGKFRRPADLWTPDFRTPMRDSLLWVYEGQTQFWGHVLSARAGLLSKQDVLDELADAIASHEYRIGRTWRTIEDTTHDPIIGLRSPKGWISWQLNRDYYEDGSLTWLDANAIISDLSGGRKSMNDFARLFFGLRNGRYGELTYTFDDVVQTLNQVQPYEWSAFLKERIYTLRPHLPLDWVAKAGYQLAYTSESTRWIESDEADRKVLDLTYSLGLVIAEDGVLQEVIWDGPAFKKGLTVSTTIVAINGHTYSGKNLRDAIIDSARNNSPIRLLVKQGDLYRDVAIDYYGGPRYPHLVRISKGDGSLDQLLEPIS